MRKLVIAAATLLFAGSLHAVCPGPVTGWAHNDPIGINNPGGPAGEYWHHFVFDTATPIGAAEMKADGGDIRLTDADCNLLDFWVQSGLNTSSTHIWVKVPALPTGATTLSIYYGNAVATRTNQASDVFGAGIAALYTFTEESGTIVHDWVGGFDMNMSGTAAWTSGFRNGLGAVEGFAAGRLYYAGNGPALGAGDFTAVTFFNPPTVDGNTRGLFGNYNSDGTSGWTLKLQGGDDAMLLTNQGGNWCQSGVGSFTSGEWQMITGRRDSGVTQTILRNGVSQGDTCAGDARNVDNSGPFELGRSYNNQYPFNGALSFAAVYTTALSDADILEMYNALTAAVIEDPVITSANNTSFTVGQAGSFNVTVTPASPAPTYGVTGTLPSGVSLNTSTGELSGTPALGTVGSYPVTITADNGSGNPASQEFTLNVIQVQQTITFPPIPTASLGQGTVTLEATATSGLTIAYSSLTPSVCTVAGNIVTLLAEGTCTIAANQAGDANTAAAPQETQSFAVVAEVPALDARSLILLLTLLAVAGAIALRR
jgi:hypothetical protein